MKLNYWFLPLMVSDCFLKLILKCQESDAISNKSYLFRQLWSSLFKILILALKRIYLATKCFNCQSHFWFHNRARKEIVLSLISQCKTRAALSVQNLPHGTKAHFLFCVWIFYDWSSCEIRVNLVIIIRSCNHTPS